MVNRVGNFSNSLKRNLVIFGNEEMAQLAHFYFSNDSNYEVVAFCVDSQYIKEPTFCGLPVTPFESITSDYPSDDFDFFVAVGYSKLNSIRKRKFFEVKQLGYKLVSYISSKATIFSQENIGENCFIFENSVIQPFSIIGNNVIIWSGALVAHHSVVKDHTFIAPNAVICGRVEIGEQCFIGANSTVRDHIKIGDKSVIGAGALLLADVDEQSLYIGNVTEKAKISSQDLKRI